MRQSVGATLVLHTRMAVVLERSDDAIALFATEKYCHVPRTIYATSVTPSWRVGGSSRSRARQWSRSQQRTCTPRAATTWTLGNLLRRTKGLVTDTTDDV